MAIPESLLTVSQYTGTGYQPLVDYGSWRVAVLRYIDELLPGNLEKMQRHNETDEVFVLLEGRCILFIGIGAEAVTSVEAVDMQPNTLYNVRRQCWHAHTLTPDATLVIIENRDTGEANSSVVGISPALRQEIVALTQALWKGTE